MFKVNAEKSFFSTNRLECIGFRITRQGIIPSPDKVGAIKNIVVPTTYIQLRSCIGLINYYREM